MLKVRSGRNLSLVILVVLALLAAACAGSSGGQDPLEAPGSIPSGGGQDPLGTSPDDGGDSGDSSVDDSDGFLCFSPVLAPLAFIAFGLVLGGRSFSRRPSNRRRS